MSGPDRLIAGEATDFERALLGAWSRRQPSAEARAKVLALAGAGLGAAMLGNASATAAKAASTSIAPKAMVGWSAAMAKWIAVGLIGATATAGAVAYVNRANPASTSTSTSTSTPTSTPTATATPTPTSTPTSTSTSTPTPTRASNEPATTLELGPNLAPTVKAKAPSATRSSTLDEEVAAIDQARVAVTNGDATTALQIINAYDAKYPGGALSQESAEIRIEALVAQGNRAAAERLAAKFTAAHPTSPYVHRIRALLGEPPGETKR